MKLYKLTIRDKEGHIYQSNIFNEEETVRGLTRAINKKGKFNAKIAIIAKGKYEIERGGVKYCCESEEEANLVGYIYDNFAE